MTGKATGNPVQLKQSPLPLKKSGQNPLQQQQPGNNPLQLLQSPQINKQVIQRVEREATVAWEITHLVKEEKESLFGESDALANELPVDEGGQLTKGQQLLIDDEPVILSRRGANQEDTERRKADKTGSQTHKWIRVLAIKTSEGRVVNVSNKNVYVRGETITFTSQPPDKIKGPQKDIEIVEVIDWDKEKMDDALTEIESQWIKLGDKSRRRSIGLEKRNKKEKKSKYLCSGPDWDQFDEGPDVASDMRNKADRVPYKETQKLWIFKAVYKGEKDPIAVMIVEIRKDDEGGPDFMYVRWLVGHPAKGGGGSELIKKAKALLVEEKLTTIKLDSAHSAAEWYEGRGKDFTDKGAAQHVCPGKDCGCREMEFTRKNT